MQAFVPLTAGSGARNRFAPAAIESKACLVSSWASRRVLVKRSASSKNDTRIIMSIQTGYGLSVLPATAEAVKEAVSNAGVSSPVIAFIGCTTDRDVEEVYKEFKKNLPTGTAIHGLTSSGGLLTSNGIVKNGVGCLLIHAPAGSFVAASDLSGNASKAAAELKKSLSSELPQAILMSTVPGQEEGCIAEIEAVFGKSVPIYGGTAGDNELAGAWKVISSAGVSGTGVSLVAVGSKGVKFGVAFSAPYKPTSKVVTATKVDGKRRVFEFDGKPASDWVYQWLGPAVEKQYKEGGLVLQPTATSPICKQNPQTGEYTACHLAALGNANEKHVDFFVPIEQGAKLTVMDSGDGPSTGYAKTLEATYKSAKQAGQLSNPKAGILIYCGGMAIAVGQNLNAGLAGGYKSSVGAMPLLGLTCFGEQIKNVQSNLSMGMIMFE
eukprot:CAMPEP_0184699174 /NCGR_PEP_ID=MMETSP0313-20130426/5535_1 /TAXON_ID=2792 /ORGANISM="Porphyridium aerugineum, Strain SAG 1380-2" /LENGTH=436 /DNA_ID=CAMNT_0027158221 /DNA_START=23 /DNA_END=1333 /DNA_ORIENTATION=+